MAEDYMINMQHDELFTPVDVDKPNYIKVVGVAAAAATPSTT